MAIPDPEFYKLLGEYSNKLGLLTEELHTSMEELERVMKRKEDALNQFRVARDAFLKMVIGLKETIEAL